MPRVPSGKTPTARPARRVASAVRIAVRSTWVRSSGIWPARSRNGPIGPLNISSLVSACTGRGEQIASSGTVDPADVVGGHHHRPVRRDTVGAVDLEVEPRLQQTRRDRSSGAQQTGVRCADSGDRGQLSTVDAESLRHDLLTDVGSAAEPEPASTCSTMSTTCWTTSSRVNGVVSRWIGPVGHQSTALRHGRCRSRRGAAGRPGSPRPCQRRSPPYAGPHGLMGPRSGRTSPARRGRPPSRCRAPRRRCRPARSPSAAARAAAAGPPGRPRPR